MWWCGARDSAVLRGQYDKPDCPQAENNFDFIIISYFGKVNESYRIVTISSASCNRFCRPLSSTGGGGVFNDDISVFSIDKLRCDGL